MTKRVGWTKLERIEKTGRWFNPARVAFDSECYLCRKPIASFVRHMVGKVQSRAYRSMRDIGDTQMTVRICGACTFTPPGDAP